MGVAEYPAALSVAVTTPTDGVALQDAVTLQATATGAQSVKFFVREPGGANGISIGYDNLTASFDPATGTWKYSLATAALPDGFYMIFATAESSAGNEVTSDIVSFSIRNWASIKLLPATPANNAGRTMPVKFGIRVASNVDPQQPFVHNEGLEIRIYSNSATPPVLLQTSRYGLFSADYRINDTGQFYITNFKTEKIPETYSVKIVRTGYVIGEFTFKTIR